MLQSCVRLLTAPLVHDPLSDCACVTADVCNNLLCLCFMNVPNLGLTIFARALRKSENLILARTWSQKYRAANERMKGLANIHPLSQMSLSVFSDTFRLPIDSVVPVYLNVMSWTCQKQVPVSILIH